MTTFTLSIEETFGVCRQHGFHLGTIEAVARKVVEDKMAAFRTHDLPAITMALKQNGKIVDVLYRSGNWHSDIDNV